jgi:GGDEF domain-containing protein
LSAVEGEQKLRETLGKSRTGYLALSDVDKLRDFNGLYGKQMMNFMIDEYLNTLHAEALKYGGFALRWGGDEWIIYLPAVVAGQGQEILERMRKMAVETANNKYGIAKVDISSVNEKQLETMKAHRDIMVANPIGNEYIILFKVDGGSPADSLEKLRVETGVKFILNGFHGGGWALAPNLSMGALKVEDLKTDATISYDKFLATARAYLGRALSEAKKTRYSMAFGIYEESTHTSGSSIIKPFFDSTKLTLKLINSIPEEATARKDIAKALVSAQEVTVIKILPTYQLGTTNDWSRFKDINTQYGYLGGDEMIQLLYQEINKAVATKWAKVLIARSPPDELILYRKFPVIRDAGKLRDMLQEVADRINGVTTVKVRFDVLVVDSVEVKKSFKSGKATEAQIFQRIDEAERLIKSGDQSMTIAQTQRTPDNGIGVFRYAARMQKDVTSAVSILVKEGRKTAYDAIMESRKVQSDTTAATKNNAVDITTIVATVLQGANPLSPLNMNVVLARQMAVNDTITSEEQLFGKTVVQVSPRPDNEKLGYLNTSGVKAFAITLGSSGRYLFNVAIPVPGRRDRATIRVSAEKDQSSAGAPVWTLRLSSTMLDRNNEVQQMLLLGRGALAVIDRLKGDRPLRKKLEATGLNIGKIFDPGVVEMDGPLAVFAHPEAIRDEYGSELFKGTSFIYALQNQKRLLAIDGELQGVIDARYLENGEKGKVLDINGFGAMLADGVTGETAAIKEYPELEGIAVETRAGVGMDEEAIKAIVARLYLPSIINKQAGNTLKPFATVTEVVLPSALRKSVDDPGIGKLSDIEKYMKEELEPAGANTIQLAPLNKPLGDSPFEPLDYFAGDDQLVDWMQVEETVELLKKGLLSMSDITAPGEDIDAVNRKNVADREFLIARKIDALVAGEPVRQAERVQFEKANVRWLNAYAEKMAASRVLGIAAGKVTNEDVRSAQQRNTSDFEQYVAVYRLTQWLFGRQLRSTLHSLHAAGDKTLFWMDITPENFQQAEPVLRHWFNYGFDGVRINVRTANDKIINEAFIRNLKSMITRLNPEAIVSLRLPKGTDEALVRAAREQGFYNIRMLSDILIKGKTAADEWVEVDAPESLRPHLDPFLQEKFGKGDIESFYKELAKSSVLNGASYVSFMIGTLCGDDVRALWTDANGREHFNYRIPLKGDARYQLNLGRSIAGITGGRRVVSPDVLFAEGYRVGVNYTRLPVLNEDAMAALDKVRQLALIDGSGMRHQIAAAGLHTVPHACGLITASGEGGQAMFERQGKDYFFSAIYDTLSSVSGMRQNEWPSGWSYFKNIEKASRFSKDGQEQMAYVFQAAGFLRAINEKMAAQEYVTATMRLSPEKEQDARILTPLLSEENAFGVTADAMEALNPETMNKVPADVERYYRTDPQLSVLLDVIRGGSRDLPVEQALREVAARSNGKDLPGALLLVRALVKVRSEQGRSKLEIEAETREALNPFYSELLKEGMLSELLTGVLSDGGPESQQWAIIELLKLFELFAEPKLKSVVDRTKQIFQLLNGNAIKGIISAG